MMDIFDSVTPNGQNDSASELQTEMTLARKA